MLVIIIVGALELRMREPVGNAIIVGGGHFLSLALISTLVNKAHLVSFMLL